MVEIAGQFYNAVVGSDVSTRDGMYLEVTDGRDAVLEVFYSDADGAMTFTAFRPNLPLALVEWAISEAELQLPPSS